MEDKEKNQKTVVAFIAGLLIGGLLVWVFSIAPNNDEAPENTNQASRTAQNQGGNGASTSTGSETNESGDDANDQGTTSTVSGARAETKSVSSGSISVDDQKVGTQVSIASVTMPVDNGWIVVHEENADGTLGNALGAARYSEAAGLKPMTVHLLRAMTEGGKYRAVLYAETTGYGFNLAQDAALLNGSSRIEDAFTATAS